MRTANIAARLVALTLVARKFCGYGGAYAPFKPLTLPQFIKLASIAHGWSLINTAMTR